MVSPPTRRPSVLMCTTARSIRGRPTMIASRKLSWRCVPTLALVDGCETSFHWVDLRGVGAEGRLDEAHDRSAGGLFVPGPDKASWAGGVAIQFAYMNAAIGVLPSPICSPTAPNVDSFVRRHLRFELTDHRCGRRGPFDFHVLHAFIRHSRHR
jgi:hypothetical protein